MRKFLTFLILMAAAVVGRAQGGSDIAATISKQTGCSYACVEQAIALETLTIRKPDGFTEVCDSPGFIVVIEGNVSGCDGSPDAVFSDKVIILEDENFRSK